MQDKTQEVTVATIQGKWLRSRSQRGPSKPVTTLAASGKAGISQRYPLGSNMAGLLGMPRLDAGRCEFGQGRLDRRWRQRLFVQRRFLARLAQLLPDAHIQRTARAIKHEDQGERNGGFAGGHCEDEQDEDLPLQVAAVAPERHQV